MTLTATTAIAARSLAHPARAMLAHMRARRDYRRMLELDDCHLRDMGVTRTAVRAAIAAA